MLDDSAFPCNGFTWCLADNPAFFCEDVPCFQPCKAVRQLDDLRFTMIDEDAETIRDFFYLEKQLFQIFFTRMNDNTVIHVYVIAVYPLDGLAVCINLCRIEDADDL